MTKVARLAKHADLSGWLESVALERQEPRALRAVISKAVDKRPALFNIHDGLEKDRIIRLSLGAYDALLEVAEHDGYGSLCDWLDSFVADLGY